MFDQVTKNVSRSGILANTLHFLRLCVILEPMQELMSRQKFQNIPPRDCLRNIVMNRWKRMTSIPNQPPKAGIKVLMLFKSYFGSFIFKIFHFAFICS